MYQTNDNQPEIVAHADVRLPDGMLARDLDPACRRVNAVGRRVVDAATWRPDRPREARLLVTGEATLRDMDDLRALLEHDGCKVDIAFIEPSWA